MVVSDIHGSVYYCKKMLERFEDEKADRLLILGDILYHGPRNNLPKEYEPKKVTESLNNISDKILAVRGNCDSEVDQMVLDFPIMAEFAFFMVGERLIYATHGHIFNTSNPPKLKRGDILLHGHTHIPAWKSFDNDNLYLNPGSISIPKEDSANGYMIIEAEDIQWKNLDGEVYHSIQL